MTEINEGNIQSEKSRKLDMLQRRLNTLRKTRTAYYNDIERLTIEINSLEKKMNKLEES